jgi:hypothetical protein
MGGDGQLRVQAASELRPRFTAVSAGQRAVVAHRKVEEKSSDFMRYLFVELGTQRPSAIQRELGWTVNAQSAGGTTTCAALEEGRSQERALPAPTFGLGTIPVFGLINGVRSIGPCSGETGSWNAGTLLLESDN